MLETSTDGPHLLLLAENYGRILWGPKAVLELAAWRAGSCKVYIWVTGGDGSGVGNGLHLEYSLPGMEDSPHVLGYLLSTCQALTVE